jgi:colanic acid/amylovoran biosynthesis glycosyltransferase
MKQLTIGIVLNKYPVVSETFIDTFIGHLNSNKVVVFAQQEQQIHNKIKLSVKPYINKLPGHYQILAWITILFRMPFNATRCIKLFRKGIPLKQIIADANIWTTPALDVLHFPFANNAFGREHYAEVLGAKMTMSFRGSDINVYPIYHNKTYEQLWPYVSKVQCNSIELAQKLKEHKIPENIPVEIIPPALRAELKDIEPNIPNTDHIGTVDNPLVIVTLGRLHWVKDYPLALRTMAELKKRGIRFEYHILGEGVEREQLMFLIHELGLSHEVHLHGRVDATDITQNLRQAHIYLQTSLAEGFSNACLEAQAFGLPCIVPAISGMSACIEDGKTGSIVRRRTESDFADAIVELKQTLHAHDPIYTANRIKSTFSLETQRKQWHDFFESLFAAQ